MNGSKSRNTMLEREAVEKSLDCLTTLGRELGLGANGGGNTHGLKQKKGQRTVKIRKSEPTPHSTRPALGFHRLGSRKGVES